MDVHVLLNVVENEHAPCDINIRDHRDFCHAWKRLWMKSSSLSLLGRSLFGQPGPKSVFE